MSLFLVFVCGLTNVVYELVCVDVSYETITVI